MKLVRYGKPGREKPGMIDHDGNLRDLSRLVDDISPKTVTPKALKAIRRYNVHKLPLVLGKKRLGPCLSGVGKFIAIGLNYTDHAKEAGMKLPGEPIVFSKFTSCISGPNDNVELPKKSKKSDWEVELAFVIGTEAKNVTKKAALDHVAGYCIVNDVSERAFQLEHGGQWVKGKSADTFGPLGPWLVTADEIKNPQKLKLWLELNGKRRQEGSTANMIFSVAHIVWYLSKFCTLMPGDLICTGTPAGVGMGAKPQRFLKPGDEMRLGIDGLGEQCQQVVRG